MAYDDYFTRDEYYKDKEQFFAFLKELCGKNYGIDGPSYLADIIMAGKLDEVLDKYELNISYFVYWLLVKYATRKLDENILDNPLITEKNLTDEIKWVVFSEGKIHFKPFVSSLSLLRGLPSVRKNKFYNNIYLGKVLGHCHNYSLAFNQPDVTYVTALIPSWHSGIRVLHSYIENTKRNEITDVSRNLVFPKDEFNALVNPDIISEITNSEFQEDLETLKNWPKANPRDYLVDKPKVLAKAKKQV